MPASITHMLIAEKVRERLKTVLSTSDDEIEFAKNLDKHSNYMALGALGPDLPYYENVTQQIFNAFLDQSDKPMGIDQWSYQLHSKNPNDFPLRMLEGIWRDSGKDWDEEDMMKFSFACGFLTHIAADQIIHPLVNDIAGPYYKSGANRSTHRKAEVYQDIVLYYELKGQSLLEQSPNEWCDLNSGFGANTDVWFRYFIQKAFVEAHSVTPAESQIENWVDGILLVLRGMSKIGPYRDAARDYEASKKKKSDDYKRFWGRKGMDYVGDYFTPAVELATIYVQAAFKVYQFDKKWDDTYREKFRKVVRNTDLSAPLEDEILKKAQAAIQEMEISDPAS